MTFLMYVISGLLGWCPMPPKPKPPTPKDPILGILGGITGAYLVKYALSIQGPITGIDFIAMMLGAFAVGKVFQQLGNWLLPGPQQN